MQLYRTIQYRYETKILRRTIYILLGIVILFGITVTYCIKDRTTLKNKINTYTTEIEQYRMEIKDVHEKLQQKEGGKFEY